MNPPHVILSGNYVFKKNLLSKDRWQVYEIKNNKLGKKNQLIKNKFLKETIKKSQ